MKIRRIIALIALGLGAAAAFAQTTLTQTTLTAAVASSSIRTLTVASASGIVAPSALNGSGSLIYVDSEAMAVEAVNGTTITVQRGAYATKATAHISGTAVLFGPPNAFTTYDQSGACANGSGQFAYSPLVNLTNGNEWLCSSVTGSVVPGWGNSAPALPTAAVASAAGAILPSGPLFHITGTAAITGFTIPVGFDPKGGQSVCAIPDGAFTTTTAGNIALGSTAVVGKTLCWTYDANTAKFYPSY